MLLIVDKSRKNGKIMCNIAYISGILSHSVTPYELLKEISPHYSAVLMVNPDSYKEDREYYDKIRSYILGIPLFAFNTEKSCHRTDEYFDKIFYEKFSPVVINDMMSFARSNSLRPLGKYCGFGYQASAQYASPEFFDEELSLTKTQLMILRLLLRVYPSKMSTADIFKYAFKSGKQIELASIRTHISMLNKNCRVVTNRNAVEFVANEGYAFNAPKKSPQYS